MTAAAAPERVPAIVATGSWNPRPDLEMPTDTNEREEALRRGGTRALVDLFEITDGDSFDREFPSWARAVTLRADPEALLAAQAPELWNEGIVDKDLRSFPRPGAPHRRGAGGRGRRRRQGGRDDPQRAELAVAGPGTRRGVGRERAHGPNRPSVPRLLVSLVGHLQVRRRTLIGVRTQRTTSRDSARYRRPTRL